MNQLLQKIFTHIQIEENMEHYLAVVEASKAYEKAKQLVFDVYYESTIKNLEKAFQELFDTYPQLTAFDWRQYVPSFNDGDACYFTVNNWGTCWFTVDGVTFDVGDYADYEEYDYNTAKSVLKQNGLDEVGNEICCLIGAVPYDIMEKRFGTYSHVKVTREGIEEDEYYDY